MMTRRRTAATKNKPAKSTKLQFGDASPPSLPFTLLLLLPPRPPFPFHPSPEATMSEPGSSPTSYEDYQRVSVRFKEELMIVACREEAFFVAAGGGADPLFCAPSIHQRRRPSGTSGPRTSLRASVPQAGASAPFFLHTSCRLRDDGRDSPRWLVERRRFRAVLFRGPSSRR